MLFPTKRRRRRRELFDAGFTDAWRDLCAARFAWWEDLDDGERVRLEAVALGLIAGADWEPANGFTLTEEMQVLIAAQAALLTVNLPFEDPYQDVHAIIVHPTTVVLDGEHSQVGGVVSDDPMPILGQAEYHGPVLVAWDEVADDVVHHGDGRNVVFHEFAHKLDMLDGDPNGCPPLHAGMALAAWRRAFSVAYEDFCRRVDEADAREEEDGGKALAELPIDPYGSESPGEFFAVASEGFFETPELLEPAYPAVYGQLREFYRQDPPARLAAAGG